MSIFMLIICLVLFAGVTAIKRDWALALLIVLLPTYQIRFTFFGIPTTFLELLIGVCTAVWLLSLLVSKERIRVPHAWLLGSVLFAGALATATSVDLQAGIGLFKAYVVEPMILYTIAINTLSSRRSYTLLVAALSFCVLIVGAVALLQVVHVLPIPEPYASEIPSRATSVFAFPTAIGKLTGMLIAFCAALAVTVKKNNISSWLRACLLASAAVGVLANALSINRAALIGIVTSGVVCLFLMKKYRIAVASLLCIVIVVFAVPQLRSNIVDVFQRKDTSADVHVVMWRGTLRLLAAHPVFGAGLGGFPALYDVYRDPAHVELFPNPDQLWLTLWAEMGIAGLIAFHWLFFVWLKSSKKLLTFAEIGSFPRGIGIAAICALIAFLVHGIFDSPYFKNDLAAAFWLVFALIISMQERETAA